MFSFDFGKSLLKQVDSFRRLTPQQQQKREAAVIHQLDTYAKKYMQVLANPGTANPGLLKNGAEALLEAALALKESRISYATFAEMVARSRKVQVVPQLAGLIDKLLELPTDLKSERIAMLNWRISTGSLKPEKHLRYQSEHAQLTGEAADWKDYASRVSNYLKKGELRPGSDACFFALEELVANKGKLGDRALTTQLLLAQSLIERKNTLQAEELLIEMAREHKELPGNFLEVVSQLVSSRSEASWELQQLIVTNALAAYQNNVLPWNNFREYLDQAQKNPQELVDMLFEVEGFATDEKMRRFALQCITRLEPAASSRALVRWQILIQKAGIIIPSEEQDLFTNAARGEQIIVLPEDVVDTAAKTKSEAAPAEEPVAAEHAEEAVEPEALAAEPFALEVMEPEAAPSQPAQLETPEPEAAAAEAVGVEDVEAEAVAAEPADEPAAEDEEPVASAEQAAAEVLEPPVLIAMPDAEPEAEMEEPVPVAGDGEPEELVELAPAPALSDEAETAGDAPAAQDQPEAAEVAAEEFEPETNEQAGGESGPPELAAVLEPAVAPEPAVTAELQAADGEEDAFVEAIEEPASVDETDWQEEVLSEAILQAAGLEPVELEQAPQEAEAVLADSAVEAPAPETDAPALAAAAEVEPEALPAAQLDLHRIATLEDLIGRLEEWAGRDAPTDQMLEDLITALADSSVSEQLANEAILWLGQRYDDAGLSGLTIKAISLLHTEDMPAAARLLEQVRELAAGSSEPEGFVPSLGRLAIDAGEYESGLEQALLLAEDDPAREEMLQSIQEQILTLREPQAGQLMTLAKAARAGVNDPQGGFEAATTASLLGLHDPEVQEQYNAWREAVPREVLSQQRAQQAAFICAQQSRPDLLEVTIEEIEALGTPVEEWSKPMEWLELVRPVLDELNAESEKRLRLRWTRLYLSYMARSAERERLPDALMSATEMIEPAAAMELVTELAGAIPAETRRVVECEALLRQGNWERALSIALKDDEGSAGVVPIQRFCALLPDDALLPASQRLTQALVERGDDAGKLLLVKTLDARFGVSADQSGHSAELQGFIDQVLTDLCDRQYEPAVRFRLAKGDSTDAEQTARDLLSLAGEDLESWDRLEVLFDRLVPAGTAPELLKSMALGLADNKPELALTSIARAGLASGEVHWALEQIRNRQIVTGSDEDVSLLVELASASKEPPVVLEVAQDLAAAGAGEAAALLVQKVLDADPDSDLARITLIQLQLSGGAQSLEIAMGELLKLAQLYQERGIRPREALESLRPAVELACEERPGEPEAQHLLLTLYALCGEMDRASAQVQQIMQAGPQAADGLLSLFERLAMQDTDLPSPLLIAWGRALFRAGRIGDALNRLAGLREAVVDYPEYIELLNEIKEGGGGPGASMQLGEAYLRVNLWQRSAEEYAAALSDDPTLAEPILTQLRHHAALDPIPMKYPLHLLGLRAVATSNRPMDWGWALSALTWLTPRWSPEELYSLARQLWGQLQRGDLLEEQQIELLLHLFKLAGKLGRADEALEYLALGWDVLATPPLELRNALKELDLARLSDDPALRYKLKRFQLESAILQDDPYEAAALAQELAAFSDEGRVKALALLGTYKEGTSDPMHVLLARLKLLDVSTEEGRDTFVSELLGAAGADLPADQVHALIGTVLDMLRGSVDNPELTRLLLLLFTQLGDQARAWQLALCHVLDREGASDAALDVVAKIAADDFAVAQQLALLEIQILRQDYNGAAEMLDRLNWSNLGELAGLAAELVEALLGTPLTAAARRWLIGHYRDTGRPEQAADMLVWAYAAGNPQPAEWLFEERSAPLLYRAAMVYELQGNLEAAKRAYQRAREGKCDDRFLAASIRIRLMDHVEAAGNLEEARRLNAEALELVPGHDALQRKLSVLNRAINQQMIDEARRQPDNTERTLRIARLMRNNGDVNQAISELQSGISRGQDALDIFVELAECFVKHGEHAIGRRAYLEVLRRIERGEGAVDLKLQVLYGLAQAEEDLGSVSEAVQRLEQLLLIRRDYLDGRQRLDRLLSLQRQPARKSAPGASSQIVDEILSLLSEQEDSASQGS